MGENRVNCRLAQRIYSTRWIVRAVDLTLACNENLASGHSHTGPDTAGSFYRTWKRRGLLLDLCRKAAMELFRPSADGSSLDPPLHIERLAGEPGGLDPVRQHR